MPEIEGFILTGGASSRMGRDKSLLKLGGRTFVERAAISLSAIASQSITLVGAASGESLEIKLADDVSIDLRRISDVPIERENGGENRGRAAAVGLYTALSHAKTEWLAVLACDLPFVSGELFERLVFLLQNGRAKSRNLSAIVPIQPDGRKQPLCALYRREPCLSAVEKLLAGDDWSLRTFLSGVETLSVSFAEIADLQDAELFFFNANTPEDYETARQIEHLKNG